MSPQGEGEALLNLYQVLASLGSADEVLEADRRRDRRSQSGMPDIVKPPPKKQGPISFAWEVICMIFWAYIAVVVLFGWFLGSLEDHPANHAFATALMVAALLCIARMRRVGKTDSNEG